MVRSVDPNSVVTLACRFAPLEAGMSQIMGAIGADDEDVDEDFHHVNGGDDENVDEDSHHVNDGDGDKSFHVDNNDGQGGDG